MPRTDNLVVNFDAITGQDWADAAAIMRSWGVDPGLVSLAAVQANPGATPVPVLTALIYVSLRKESPRITPARCVRLAQAVSRGE
jgi:hypothetical protein